MVTEIRRKKEPVARKSRRWVEAAAAITHYLTGMSHRDCQEDTSAALTSGWLLLRERPPFLRGLEMTVWTYDQGKELKVFATEDPRAPRQRPSGRYPATDQPL
jgi:hypothetical protein